MSGVDERRGGTAGVGGSRSVTLSSRVRETETEILIERGLRGRLPELLRSRLAAPRYAVVSDRTVADLYGAEVRDALIRSGAEADLFAFPPGESSKSVTQWEDLVEGFGAAGLGRDGCVVAVGGGVTGDLAGFAAASYARGVRFVQVPTSLLAMIDASIGGKTGLDLTAGKNLAGAFHDPHLVVVDPDVLETLPTTELRTGLAEAVKHGVIADADYFEALASDTERIVAGDPPAVDRVVHGSIGIKTDVVARDARESGERATLNFGHTLAHGLERVTDFAVPHGQAVAIGMVVEARIGEALGVTVEGTWKRLRDVLSELGLPVSVPRHVDPEALIQAARSDKKARAGAVRYVLLERVGVVARTAEGGWVHEVEEGRVRSVIGSGA